MMKTIDDLAVDALEFIQGKTLPGLAVLEQS